jgi:hypothetical protein
MNDFKRKRRKRIHAKAAEKTVAAFPMLAFLCGTLRGSRCGLCGKKSLGTHYQNQVH